MSENETDALSEFGSELSFATDEETLQSVREIIDEIEPQVDDLVVETDPSESVGSFSDDEYNALLDIYDEPRSESETGPLVGLDFAVKDCIAVESLEMTCAVQDFSYVPSADAAAVERLLSAGANVVGKANMEPFAFGPTGEHSEYGTPTNPTAPDRVPGGSSSGSGAAVAGGLVDFALGTDTGGSVRLPAACCGVVGIKPTHGLVPRHGFVDLVPWTDTIGPLARDVETAAAVVETMAGHDVRDPASSHVDIGSLTDGLEEPEGSGLTIGLVESLVDAADEEVAEPVTAVTEELAAEFDVTVERVSVDLSEISKAYPLLVGDFSWVIRQRGIIRGEGTGYEEEWRAAFSEFLENHEFNSYITSRAMPAGYLDEKTEGRSYVALRRRAIEFQRQLADVFADVDLLVTPTTRIVPPTHETIGVYKDSLGMTGNTVPFSFAQTPAVTLPVDDADGVPISAQVVAPKFEDARAIRGARLIEAIAE
jgi:aspartyl-tRNA(Asn)/glutamyl-tRNA(Gln) amidotransferase subunit A